MVIIGPVNLLEVGLSYTGGNVKLKIGEKIIGTGTLSISQSSLAWQPDHLEDGISFLWKQISVHGISSATPAKCIYFMLDHQLTWPGVYEVTAASPYINIQNGVEDEGNATDEEENDDEIFQDAEEEQITECWLIPEDVNTVDTIFQAMTECQALHPDSADSVSEESDYMDDEGLVEAEELVFGEVPEIGAGGESDTIEAQGGIKNLNLNDDQRFTDADE
uniref:Methylosome subunit pICln n=1 Tax=Glossina palpalis gambiensis TaxID=67801 RepID=A0A1B0AT30_9MUSC